VHDRRAVASLVLGFTGLGLGVASVLSFQPLALLGGLCAAGAGTLAWWPRPPPEAQTTARPSNTDRSLATRPDTSLIDPEMRLIDPVTGLYSERYLLVALDARLAAARRRLRPLSVAMLEVVDDSSRNNPAPAVARAVADAMHATLREADSASRFANGRYVLMLEDTAETGAIWTVERLRSALAAELPGSSIRAGIACYPAHAFDFEEILQQAEAALRLARTWRQDRIEVATGD
jgi:two-component system cell cycle response regulator